MAEMEMCADLLRLCEAAFDDDDLVFNMSTSLVRLATITCWLKDSKTPTASGGGRVNQEEVLNEYFGGEWFCFELSDQGYYVKVENPVNFNARDREVHHFVRLEQGLEHENLHRIVFHHAFTNMRACLFETRDDAAAVGDAAAAVGDADAGSGAGDESGGGSTGSGGRRCGERISRRGNGRGRHRARGQPRCGNQRRTHGRGGRSRRSRGRTGRTRRRRGQGRESSSSSTSSDGTLGPISDNDPLTYSLPGPDEDGEGVYFLGLPELSNLTRKRDYRRCGKFGNSHDVSGRTNKECRLDDLGGYGHVGFFWYLKVRPRFEYQVEQELRRRLQLVGLSFPFSDAMGKQKIELVAYLPCQLELVRLLFFEIDEDIKFAEAASPITPVWPRVTTMTEMRDRFIRTSRSYISSYEASLHRSPRKRHRADRNENVDDEESLNENVDDEESLNENVDDEESINEMDDGFEYDGSDESMPPPELAASTRGPEPEPEHVESEPEAELHPADPHEAIARAFYDETCMLCADVLDTDPGVRALLQSLSRQIEIHDHMDVCRQMMDILISLDNAHKTVLLDHGRYATLTDLWTRVMGHVVQDHIN